MDASPQAIFSSAACFRSYSNATTGDLLELGLLAIIAMNISPVPPVTYGSILLETGGYILLETGGRILLET